ncbi:NAD(P)H-binding protein [Aureivirga sp. CE67]|uniref:NAD(P)H-binding protein n=1 Tax=Aureivirga sp. CE67 TaxID=1788983 RepID=UPI0018C9CE39|nr:NAD(P)H-binding protein [Aureivirga sp. CE67]
MEFRAVVIGATGLVGSFLVKKLIADENCVELRLIVRRKTKFEHPKVKEIQIDFDNYQDYVKNIKGDVLFSCLGTTRKQAGSKANQIKVDYTYQYYAAKSAKQNGIKTYALVSSPYQDVTSSNYYRKMKADLEVSVRELDFEQTIILRPNGIVGKREIERKWEGAASKVFDFLGLIIPPLRKLKSIKGEKIAEILWKLYHKIQNKEKELIILSRNELLTV